MMSTIVRSYATLASLSATGTLILDVPLQAHIEGKILCRQLVDVSINIVAFRKFWDRHCRKGVRSLIATTLITENQAHNWML